MVVKWIDPNSIFIHFLYPISHPYSTISDTFRIRFIQKLFKNCISFSSPILLIYIKFTFKYSYLSLNYFYIFYLYIIKIFICLLQYTFYLVLFICIYLLINKLFLTRYVYYIIML